MLQVCRAFVVLGFALIAFAAAMPLFAGDLDVKSCQTGKTSLMAASPLTPSRLASAVSNASVPANSTVGLGRASQCVRPPAEFCPRASCNSSAM
jgi:hypothetical protein